MSSARGGRLSVKLRAQMSAIWFMLSSYPSVHVFRYERHSRRLIARQRLSFHDEILIIYSRCEIQKSESFEAQMRYAAARAKKKENHGGRFQNGATRCSVHVQRYCSRSLSGLRRQLSRSAAVAQLREQCPYARQVGGKDAINTALARHVQICR